MERELWDLGIAAAAPVAAEISDAEERRAFEILPPDERRYWSGTLVVPYRWICSIEVYRSKVQVWAAAAEPAPTARAAVTAMVLRHERPPGVPRLASPSVRECLGGVVKSEPYRGRRLRRRCRLRYPRMMHARLRQSRR